MSIAEKGYANPQLLVDAGALAARLGLTAPPDRPPVVIDVRPADAFAASHIPTAAHVDLYGIGPAVTDPEPLAEALRRVEHLFAACGLVSTRPVVVYDDYSGVRAARGLWLLEYFGHPDPSLLDGGFSAWERAGLPVSTAPAAPVASSWRSHEPAPDRLAGWRDVRARLGDSDAVLLDTRSEAEYRGTSVRARRGGAIPGAVHLEWTHNLDEAGAFRPAAELRDEYARAGVLPDKEVITYCQAGYRAAHSYVALRLLGYPRVRNYVGSWQEWGNREDLPVE